MMLKHINEADDDTLNDMAILLEHGYEVAGKTIVAIDQAAAFKIYARAAQNGHISSMIRLADFYETGEICEQDREKAIQLYTAGIEAGQGMAAHNLAVLYRNLGDYKKAFELYLLEQTLDQAPIQLALCYYFGIGTSANKSKAFQIFETITNNPDNYCAYDIEDAHYYLGICYLEGTCVPQSFDLARQHLDCANEDDDHRSARELLLLFDKEMDNS